MDYLKNLFEGKEECLDDPKFSEYFITLYCADTPDLRQYARVFNKYLYIVNPKILKRLIFTMLPKSKKFYWKARFVKKGSSKETEFEIRVRKYFNWSVKEFNANHQVLLSNQSITDHYARLVGLDNRQRKEVGLEGLVQPLFKREEVKEAGLERWA